VFSDSLQNALINKKEKDYQNSSSKKLDQSSDIENSNTAATSALLTKQIVDAINKAVLQVNQVNLSSGNNGTSAFKPPINSSNNNPYANISNMMPPSHVPLSSTGIVNNFSNESNNNSNINSSNKAGNKQKNKPLPLVIPSDISSFAFQQQQQQQQNFLNFQYNQSQLNNPNSQHHIPYYHQMSANPSTSSSAHVYPHATLLKSPRLLQNDLKKQYTPPPMLSPFRKGPGLYYKYFANMFLMPNPSVLNNQFQFNQFQQNQNSNNRAPMFNHSMSCSYIYPQSNFYNYPSGLQKESDQSGDSGFLNNESEETHLDNNNTNNNINHMSDVVDGNFKENIDIDRPKQLDPIAKSKTLDKDDEISINNLKEQVLVNSNDNNSNSLHSKQSLKRPRLSKN
jgi:hypothetical protein